MSESQNKMILEYLAHGNKLTTLQALELFGCFRLASRINDLRQAGHDIHTEMLKNEETGKRYAEYSIIAVKEPELPLGQW